MTPSVPYRRLKELLKQADLPSIRFHDLRHTFATHALTSGVDAKTLAGILGHPLLIEQRLEKLIRKLLKEQEYIEFLVGRDGEFDQIVSSTIRRCQRTIRRDNSAHVWVLPYVTADYRDNEEDYQGYYDEIEVCSASADTHFKGAYQARNRAMIERSNLVVCCIQHQSGGAWQTMKYAQKQCKTCININNLLEGTE